MEYIELLLLNLLAILSFLLYFITNKLSPTYYWKLKIDDYIPVVPFFIWLYILYFPLIILGFIVSTYTKQVDYLIAITIANTIGGLFWLLFPSGCKRSLFYNKPKNISEKLLGFVYTYDREVNSFPSGHVYSTIITCYFLIQIIGFSYIFITLGILICISILFTKQHYIIDLPGGTIVALIVIYNFML